VIAVLAQTELALAKQAADPVPRVSSYVPRRSLLLIGIFVQDNALAANRLTPLVTARETVPIVLAVRRVRSLVKEVEGKSSVASSRQNRIKLLCHPAVKVAHALARTVAVPRRRLDS